MKKKKEVDDISSFSKKYKKKSKKIKQNKLQFTVSVGQHRFFKSVWIFMVFCISSMLSAFCVFGTIDLLAMLRDERTVNICIEDRKSVSRLLYESKVISDPEFFDAYLTIFNKRKKIILGTFRIKTNLDYSAIVSYLSQNSNRLDSDIVEVTIPEGKNVAEIAQILEKKGICKKEDFLKYCNRGDFSSYSFLASLKNYGKLEYKVEGYLFPDTYKLYKNSEPKYVVRKLLNNYDEKISYKGENGENLSIKEMVKKRNMDIQDIFNIASLIQAEAANEKDMYNVSSVIHNRLETNNKRTLTKESGLEKLCIDSTIWYPYRDKESVPKELVEKYQSPYNTYVHEGLPIGCICNPGLKAIDAALNPNKTSFFYYCHSKDGKAYYAKTLKEHNINLKRAGLI